MYTCFKRAWWKLNPDWPNGLEPNPNAKIIRLTVVDTEEEARAYCQEWNRTNKPNRLSIKCEFVAGSL